MERRFQVSGKMTPGRERIAAFLQSRGYSTAPHTHFVALQLRDGPIIWTHHVSWNTLTRIKHLDAWLHSLEDKALLEMRAAYERWRNRTRR